MRAAPRRHRPPHTQFPQLGIQSPKYLARIIPAAAFNDGDVDFGGAEVGGEGEDGGGPVRGEEGGVVPVCGSEEDGGAGVGGSGKRGGWRERGSWGRVDRGTRGDGGARATKGEDVD